MDGMTINHIVSIDHGSHDWKTSKNISFSEFSGTSLLICCELVKLDTSTELLDTLQWQFGYLGVHWDRSPNTQAEKISETISQKIFSQLPIHHNSPVHLSPFVVSVGHTMVMSPSPPPIPGSAPAIARLANGKSTTGLGLLIW